MFMEHYAQNRCLHIKVAKLRTGLGSAEASNLQNCQTIKRALESRNLQREIIRKKIKGTKIRNRYNQVLFFRFSTIDLLFILYQLTQFEAPSFTVLEISWIQIFKVQSCKGR